MSKTSLFLASILLISLATSCTATRMLLLASPTIHDSRHTLNAILPTSDEPEEIPCRCTMYACPAIDTLFEDGHTAGIVVVRGDSIIYSRFDEGLSLHTPADLFSLSKSFVGTLAGIAIEQGYIDSIEDSVSRYLPACAALLGDSARICDVLNMRTGMFETHLATALLYYSDNLARALPYNHQNRPHGEYHYASAATQFLAAIIEQATGVPLERYFIDNYWVAIAPKDEGYWAVDSRSGLHTKAFCGLCITPAELLKLGMIYRDGGRYNGRQIVPEWWVTHTINPPYSSDDRQGTTYHCQWYIKKPGREFLGQGLMGQILYVNRTTDTIIARFGTRRGERDWTATLAALSALPDSSFP